MFEPLFEGEPPVDVLLVLLDGDVIGGYTAAYADIKVPQYPDAEARGRIVELILERWLWSSTERRHAWTAPFPSSTASAIRMRCRGWRKVCRAGSNW